MGYLSAADMAGVANFSTAFRWHLTANHFPPYSEKFIEAMEQTALAAVCETANGNGDILLDMPEGIEFRGRKDATAGEIVESLHLDAFVDSEQANWTMEDE